MVGFQKFILINAYMPCDSHNIVLNDEYKEILNDVESVIVLHHEIDHVIIGGDLNTDISRMRSVHSAMLKEFCTRLSLRFCLSSPKNTVGFTYNNEATGAQSVLDHFIVSENLFGSIESYSCFHEGDNLSDHLPVCLNLDVKASFAPQSNAYALNRPSWQRATVQDKAAYQLRLKELLREVDIPFDVFSCRPFECVCEDHGRMIEQYYSDVMSAMITASKECIPSRSKKKAAGWSTYVSHHQEESIFWHKIWLSSGRPRTGWVQDIRKKTRAQYKRISRWILRNQGKLSADRMAQALSENNSRDLWGEVKKLKGGSYAQPRVVDEVEGAKDVCELFRQKYEDMYSSVSFNEHEMNALLNDVSCNVDVYCKTGKCKNHHVMHVNDVQYAVNKLKPGKSDANVDLSSDNFIYACDDLFVHISLLLNMIYSRFGAPGEMIMSILVPIPKNRKKSLNSSNNYRSIAISSIMGKILDHIVFLKHADVL
jgi:hypothetical protein